MIENKKLAIVGKDFIKIYTEQTMDFDIEIAGQKVRPALPNNVIYIPISSINSITANIKDPKSNDIIYMISIEYGTDHEKISVPISFQDLQEFESKIESL